MKDSARYVKIVEWSEVDHCEKAVFDELCRIVEDAIELYRREGTLLPLPTSGRD